jgi:hypothetical protein
MALWTTRTKDLLVASAAERAVLNIREVPVFRVGIFGQERRARAGQEKRHQFSMSQVVLGTVYGCILNVFTYYYAFKIYVLPLS